MQEATSIQLGQGVPVIDVRAVAQVAPSGAGADSAQDGTGKCWENAGDMMG